MTRLRPRPAKVYDRCYACHQYAVPIPKDDRCENCGAPPSLNAHPLSEAAKRVVKGAKVNAFLPYTEQEHVRQVLTTIGRPMQAPTLSRRCTVPEDRIYEHLHELQRRGEVTNDHGWWSSRRGEKYPTKGT